MTNQIPPRARTRTIQPAAPAQSTRAPAPRQTDDSWMHRGAVADQARVREAERQEARREQAWKPWRLWMPAGTSGDVIILDNVLGPCFYEHNLPDPQNGNKRTLFELCPKEYDDCPLCTAHGESYYIMFLSIIDMRVVPATANRPELPYTRKIMAVKHQLQPYFVRLFERHQGNLRGVHLLMTRDTSQSYSIGMPEEVATHTEDELTASFNNPERRAQDGRVVKEAGADLFPFNYGEVFARPTGDDLRRRYGGVAPAGSAAEVRDAWGGHDPAGQTTAAPVQPVASSGGAAQPYTAPGVPGDPPSAAPIQPAAQSAVQPAPAGGPITRSAPTTGSAPEQPTDLDDRIPF